MIYAVKECSYCGKSVEIQHRKRLEAERIFCSRDCQTKWKIDTGFNINCAICGKPLHRKPSVLRKAKQPITCSRKCLGELRSGLYKGEANPNYGNRGKSNPLFKGETTEHMKYLWLYAPTHPLTPKGSSHRIRQHRFVAENGLLNDANSICINGKRYLKPDMVVHHKDGDKTNNSIENLEVMTRSEHTKLHARLRREL